MALKLRLRVIPRFLASIFNGVGTVVRKDGLATYVDLDYSLFSLLPSYDPSVQVVLVRNTLDGSWGLVTAAELSGGLGYTEQVITAGATVNVAKLDGMIKINKAVGSATTVNLPASATKIGPVKIVDWKGDASTNNITINAPAGEKLNGNLTSWSILSDTGSIVATPLKDGTGYAI